MPYYVGIINDRVESLNVTLPPEEAEQRYVRFEQIDKPMLNPCYVDNIFRERTEAEIEAIASALARVNALSRSTFTKLQIRRALRELNQETVLDNLLASNPQFASDWYDAQEIDLTDEATIEALNLVEIDIDEIKLKIAGIE